MAKSQSTVSKLEDKLQKALDELDSPMRFCCARRCEALGGTNVAEWGQYEGLILESDLDTGMKLKLAKLLLQIRWEAGFVGVGERCCGVSLMAIQAVMGAAVPVLIACSLQHSTSDDKTERDIGTTLSYIAIIASLVGTTCMAVEKSRKFSDMGHATFKYSQMKLHEIDLFLGRAKQYSNASNSHRQSWQDFIERYTMINSMAGDHKNNIFHAARNYVSPPPDNATHTAMDMSAASMNRSGSQLMAQPPTPSHQLPGGEGMFSDSERSSKGVRPPGMLPPDLHPPYGTVQMPQAPPSPDIT